MPARSTPARRPTRRPPPAAQPGWPLEPAAVPPAAPAPSRQPSAPSELPPVVAPTAPTPGAFPPAYHGLRAWQRAVDLAVETHRVARGFPPAEQEALAAELRRTAYGIGGAVAAGSAVHDRAEYQRALAAARGLLARLDTLVAVGVRLNLVTDADAATLRVHALDVARLVRGLVRFTTPAVGGAGGDASIGGSGGAAATPPLPPSLRAGRAAARGSSAAVGAGGHAGDGTRADRTAPPRSSTS